MIDLRRQQPPTARWLSIASILAIACAACTADLTRVGATPSPPNQAAIDEAAARQAEFEKEAAAQTAEWQRQMDERQREIEEERRRAEERQTAARKRYETGPTVAAAGAPPPAAADVSRAAEPEAALPPNPATVGSGGKASPVPRESVAAHEPGTDSAPASVRSEDARLLQLAAERARSTPSRSYRIGPGDLLEINVFDLPEMSRKVRVASSGFIQLPLIGSVKVAGLGEADVARDIAARLSTNYLQNPQVDVFVDEYKSQQVAVTGSVAKPGLYPLTRQRYTILDMLSEAGGLTKEAGPIIEFIPAGDERGSAAFDVATAGGRFALENDPGNGITIDLHELIHGGNRAALNLPVLAGDVIFVPEAGSFTIEGWVDKPGTYPITRNTTVLAALSAGGGPLLPSRLGAVQILRSSDGGEARSVQVVDLKAIRDGEKPDMELRSGDIVRVPGHVALMVPWGIYTFVKSLISIGASIPVL